LSGDVGKGGAPYLDEPYSALTGLEHDVFVGIWLSVLVILTPKRVERLLLIFNGKVIHNETERIVDQGYAEFQRRRCSKTRLDSVPQVLF
jgi:hypothetical protein